MGVIPERTRAVKGRIVAEYYWAGSLVVYVDNRAVTTDFETTIKDIEAGREPQPNLREEPTR